MPRRSVPAGAEARVPLQCKATEGVRERLQNAAAQSGRSLAQEMEYRLAQSLSAKAIAETTAEATLNYMRDRDELLNILLGDTETISFLIDIAALVRGVEEDKNESWHQSPKLKAQLFKTLSAALPSLIAADRGAGEPSAWLRAANYAKFLPERPVKPAPEMPDGMRFMSEEELERVFFTNKDNA